MIALVCVPQNLSLGPPGLIVYLLTIWNELKGRIWKMTRGHFLESVRGNTEITLQDESVLGHQEIKFRGTKHITDNKNVRTTKPQQFYV